MAPDHDPAIVSLLASLPPPPRRRDWGRVDYAQALSRMRALHAAVVAGREPEALICLEHPPVITLGRHGKEANLRLGREDLVAQGVPVFRVERGGDVTYHGPGQAVVYLILNLKARRLGVRPLVNLVEQAVTRAVAAWGIKTQADPGRPGVWVAGRKLAALGLAVRQGVSLHGLALNVSTDLAAFDYINPCGLGMPVTSLAAELGRSPDLASVGSALCNELHAGLGSKPPGEVGGRQWLTPGPPAQVAWVWKRPFGAQ